MYRFRSPYRSTPPFRPRGFTLQEMLVCLLVSGSVAIGGVAMWSMVQENALTVAANELMTHLALARSTAVTQRYRVTLCPTTDGTSCAKAGADYTFWQHGWLIYRDENADRKPQAAEVMRAHPGAGNRLVIRSSRARSSVTYQPIGNAGGATITFAVCSPRDPVRARYVTVSNSGRVRVSHTTTSNVKCG